MNIAKTFKKWTKDATNVQFMKYRVSSQKGQVTKLRKEVHQLQAFLRDDILLLGDAATTYKSNAYPTYDAAIAEINRKYNGTADWGVSQTGSIIDLRAAFIIGDGIKPTIKKRNEPKIEAKKGKVEVVIEGEKELEWVEKFLEYNDLDEEVAQAFAAEAEMEGKIALKLALEVGEEKKEGEEEEDKDEPEISVRFISYLDKRYTVKTNPADYLNYQTLSWKETGKYKAETLEAKEFVYKKFGGRIMNPNEAAPKVMKCLTQIENLDKAERDWREINHIFAGPILYGECESKEEVKELLTAMTDTNFKIKRILAGTAKLGFITLDIKGVDSIEREIVSLVKLISGTTGIPVHFFGFVDLMSNRSTAENLMEMINAATTKERQTWIGVYEEVIRKAMVMWNDKVNQGMSQGVKLDPNKIKVDIPIITKEHWLRIEKIFLPAAIAGKISDEAFLTQIPGLDVKAELDRKKEREASEIEQIKGENENLKDENLKKDLLGGGRED